MVLLVTVVVVVVSELLLSVVVLVMKSVIDVDAVVSLSLFSLLLLLDRGDEALVIRVDLGCSLSWFL